MATRVAQIHKRGWQKWRRRGGRVVAGHAPYGLYRDHMPADTRYVTFLREPVDRVLSHFCALIRPRGGPRDQGPTADSLEQALAEMRLPQLNNLATRYLCGDPSPVGDLPASALDDAKANLRDFAFVGLRERFDESIILLGRTLGRDLDPYLNRRVSVDRPSVDDIADDQRALIIEHNQLDAELFAFAERLLEDAISSAEGDFAAEVEALRAASAAANEEATRKALDWLDRELPAGSSKSKHSLLGQATLAGIPIPALKHGLNLLSVRRELGDDGQLIWSRPG